MALVSNINRYGCRHHRRRRLHLRPLQRQQQWPVADQLSGSHFRRHCRTLNRHYLSQEPSLGETRKIYLGNQCLHFCAFDRFGHDFQYCQSQPLHLFSASDVPSDEQRQLQLGPDHSLERFIFDRHLFKNLSYNLSLFKHGSAENIWSLFFSAKFWPLFGNQNISAIFYA